MTATYTYDVFASLDGYGSYDEVRGDWGGYWGRQGPEFLTHRLAEYEQAQRLVLGATTFRQFVGMLGTDPTDHDDLVVRRMVSMPATVVSTTPEAPLAWPSATLERGDGVEVVARLKQESDVPLRSHGSQLVYRPTVHR